MPKLYEYFGLIVMFYANEHEPIHVHGKCLFNQNSKPIKIPRNRLHDIEMSEDWEHDGTLADENLS
jgi:CMP-N-acetylneuraminic acid synthetase